MVLSIQVLNVYLLNGPRYTSVESRQLIIVLSIQVLNVYMLNGPRYTSVESRQLRNGLKYTSVECIPVKWTTIHEC